MRENKISVDKWLEKQITFSLRTGLIILVLSAICFFLVKTVNQRVEDQQMENDTTGLEISTMIRNVKHELFKADSIRIANNEGALLTLKDFQMEISFIVRKTSKQGVNAGYQFVTVEGGSESGNEKAQKLILRWDAIEDQPVTISPNNSEGDMIIEPLKKTKPHDHEEQQ